MINLCPCGSTKTYPDCCKRFHQGVLPKTAEELMRSRYSAYAMGLAEYIMDTTHPENQKERMSWKKEIDLFSHHTNFMRLDVLEHSEVNNEAFVTFRAHLEQGGQDVSFTEKSRFLKLGDHWYYVDGVMV